MEARLAPSPQVSTLVRPVVPVSWRHGLPQLTGARVALRELAPGDVASLLPALSAPEVSRYISAPPSSPERFAAFIEWGQRERAAGRYAAFALVPREQAAPAGLLQLRLLDPDGHAAEWGFALGADHWGAGLFVEAGRLLVQFAFDTVGVHRLEARAAVDNARGQAAMRKLGAVQEGVLRRSLVTVDGVHHDQVLWSLLADDWRASSRADAVARVH